MDPQVVAPLNVPQVNTNFPPPETSIPSAPTQAPQQPTVIQPSKPRRSFFKLFVILFLIVIAAVYGGVVYLYLQNQNLKKQDQAEELPTEEVPSPVPTPQFKPEEVKILNGSIVWEKANGETKTLVDKVEYKSVGITGFSRVIVSPDNQKICFESLPPAPEPALYTANVDGSDISEISPNRQKCLWTLDSKNIIYINSTAPTSSSDIFIYNLEAKSESNLTSEASEVTRRYDLVGLSGDGGKVICTYEEIGDVENPVKNGKCEINLETDEVSIL